MIAQLASQTSMEQLVYRRVQGRHQYGMEKAALAVLLEPTMKQEQTPVFPAPLGPSIVPTTNPAAPQVLDLMVSN